MNRNLFILLLLFPLASAAAEWRYSGEMAMTQDNAPAATTGATTMPSQPPGNAPGNSMAMPAVKAQFGEPEEIRGPVGEPPITRWQYPGYVVYFENELVITSVAGHM